MLLCRALCASQNRNDVSDCMRAFPWATELCVSNFPSMFVVEHQQTAEMLLSHCYGNGCGFWVLIYTSAAPCKDWWS